MLTQVSISILIAIAIAIDIAIGIAIWIANPNPIAIAIAIAISIPIPILEYFEVCLLFRLFSGQLVSCSSLFAHLVSIAGLSYAFNHAQHPIESVPTFPMALAKSKLEL